MSHAEYVSYTCLYTTCLLLLMLAVQLRNGMVVLSDIQTQRLCTFSHHQVQEAGKTWIQPFLWALQQCFVLFTLFFGPTEQSCLPSVCLSLTLIRPEGLCMFWQPTLYLSLSLASNLSLIYLNSLFLSRSLFSISLAFYSFLWQFVFYWASKET